MEMKDGVGGERTDWVETGPKVSQTRDGGRERALR